MIPRLRLEYPPADVLDAAQKVARFMAETNTVQLMGLQQTSASPLSAEQANRLRGFISRHARCQYHMGATSVKADEETRRAVVKDAAQALQAVYGYLNSLKAKP